MTRIILAGGRGTVEGEIGHMNPNYTVVILPDGTEVQVPTHIISRTERD